MTPPVLICEAANFHGGDPALLTRVIDALAEIDYPYLGLKVHPIAAETLALPDFSYFDVYKEIEISETVWPDILQRAIDKRLSVWIEVADLTCARVLRANFGQIAGIKLQTSVLENHEVFSALQELDLSQLTVMLNVSGQSIEALEDAVGRFRGLKPGRLALQLGFQAYPTAVDDTLLNKIAVIRAAFPGVDLALADHVDGADPFARRVPLLATALGCSIIEKHICLDRKTTRYDGSAALEPAEMAELARDLSLTSRCFGDRFIAPAEAAYLAKTLQRPIARHALVEGAMVSREDLLFRRTDAPGLALAEVEALQTRFQVLARAVPPGATLGEQDFRPAHVATIVAGRMKSSRLARKAVLPINGVPSVERCLANCLRARHVRTVVLATSTHPDDEVLGRHTLDGAVGFWRGSEDDVIKRYLGACDHYGIDIVVRVTADCPTISPEIIDILLEAHVASGADFTRARREAPGTAPQIFNTEALRRIDHQTGGAVYSEYMNQYVENNPDLFKICWVDLPSDLVADFRLTLDYKEDHQMYEKLFSELDLRSKPADLRNILPILNEKPDIAAINASCHLIYMTDPNLIAKLKEVTKIKAVSRTRTVL